MKSKLDGSEQLAVDSQFKNGKKQRTVSKEQNVNMPVAKLASWAMVLFTFVMPLLAGAQMDTTKMPAPDMATTMRSNGKIYVVVAVLVIILLGLFTYLIRLDRKIGKLEKQD